MIDQTIEEFAKNSNIKLESQNDINGFLSCYITRLQDLFKLLEFLKQDNKLKFTVLTDLFAVDFPDHEKRFEVVYSLLSLKLNRRLLIKVNINAEEKIESVTSIYPAACWYEREIFDMFGIEFNSAPDLRRILTDYGFIGHPLRKDFPVTGYVQVKYDNELEKVVYEPVLLEQEFRNFDFSSPWHGPNDVLPGDEKAKI